MEIPQSLSLLNFYLKKKNANKSFIICGGASLILQGIISRTTQDIDIIAPPIDEELSLAAESVANDLGIDSHWLNMGPTSIARDLREGWESRIYEVYRASNLVVYSISREELIFSKVWALCDRQKDKADILCMKPTQEELDRAVEFTKTKDSNPLWPEWVDKQATILRKELGYE